MATMKICGDCCRSHIVPDPRLRETPAEAFTAADWSRFDDDLADACRVLEMARSFEERGLYRPSGTTQILRSIVLPENPDDEIPGLEGK